MKVSVVYCTARHGGLDILEESMKIQTFKDFEVLVLDELNRNVSFDPSLNIRFIKTPPKKPNMFWNLSASLNEGCKQATGEIVVLLQDYIFVPEYGLQKYVDFISNHGASLVCGVGHQYKLPDFYDDPTGDKSVWVVFPGKPTGTKLFVDPRIKGCGDWYVCTPVEWEANWGAFSKEVWETVGGFDEDFDAGWGYDNVNFAERAGKAGYNIYLDMSNEVLCYSHINIFKEEKHRNESPNNQALWSRKNREIGQKLSPWRLNYAKTKE